MSGDPGWVEAWQNLYTLHLNKSSTYGTGVDPLANFAAVAAITGATPERYALERIIEKCSRAINQIDAGQPQAVKEYPDIAGLALCAEALRTRGSNDKTSAHRLNRPLP